MPQVLPANAFKTLFLDVSFFLMFCACVRKVNRGSSVTPRILGSLTVGTLTPSIKIGRSILHSLDQVVNTVADDLAGEMNKFLCLNQVFSVSRYGFSLSHIGWIFLSLAMTLPSSA